MRIPAVSFDPPVGAPLGVSRLQATATATRTAVSPDGRGSGPRYRRAARDAEKSAAEPAAEAPLVPAAPPAPPLPAPYPPLCAQRAVLDRPGQEADVVVPAVPAQRADPPADTGARPPVPGSPLDQALRRIIGAV